jgi:acylphosphatase
MRGGAAVADEARAKRYFVSGTVQGVGYRYFVQRTALWLGVSGYVRNLRDGRVEVYATGTSASLASLRKELERGPEGASVDGVTEEDTLAETGLVHLFSIRHGE